MKKIALKYKHDVSGYYVSVRRTSWVSRILDIYLRSCDDEVYWAPDWKTMPICEITEKGIHFEQCNVDADLLADIIYIYNNFDQVFVEVGGKSIQEQERDVHYDIQRQLHRGVTFLDLETKFSSSQVGWNPEKMGLSAAVTYDVFDGKYYVWEEEDVHDLCQYLRFECRKIIGFNVLDFDLRVLDGYSSDISEELRSITFDMLVDMENQLSHRVKLEDLCQATLGTGKTGSGLSAIDWYQQGRIDLIIDYCKEDVRLTYELYKFGALHGQIFYSKNWRKEPVRVQWEELHEYKGDDER